MFRFYRASAINISQICHIYIKILVNTHVFDVIQQCDIQSISSRDVYTHMYKYAHVHTYMVQI